MKNLTRIIDPDGGLSEYQELALPWLNDPYIEQYKKSTEASG